MSLESALMKKYVLGGFLVILDILLTVLENEVFNLDPGALFSVAVIAVIVIIFVIALARQPSDNKDLSFRVSYLSSR